MTSEIVVIIPQFIKVIAPFNSELLLLFSPIVFFLSHLTQQLTFR